jgi:hypothetical protein
MFLGEKMIDKNDLYRKIREEKDYIRCPKYGNSLSKFIAKNGEGIENSAISRFLMISEEEVERIYNDAVRMLQSGMKD